MRRCHRGYPLGGYPLRGSDCLYSSAAQLSLRGRGSRDGGILRYSWDSVVAYGYQQPVQYPCLYLL